MKILHVAVFTPTSTNVWQAQGFEALGHKVIRYDYRARARALTIKKRDDELIKLCHASKPDIILFAKCNKMHYRVLEACSKSGKVVMWYPDNRWSVDKELTDKFERSDYVFCSSLEGTEAADPHCNKVYRLQGGYDSKIHHPFSLPKIYDAVFIGSARGDRIEFQKTANYEIKSGFFGKAHSKLVSQTKINLSFTESKGVSNRIYKLMAAGGFVLTQPWERMHEDFGIGVHLDVFSTAEQLKYKIDFYLNDPWLRKRITKQGCEKVKEYDNINYAKRIIEVVKNDL